MERTALRDALGARRLPGMLLDVGFGAARRRLDLAALGELANLLVVLACRDAITFALIRVAGSGLVRMHERTSSTRRATRAANRWEAPRFARSGAPRPRGGRARWPTRRRPTASRRGEAPGRDRPCGARGPLAPGRGPAVPPRAPLTRPHPPRSSPAVAEPHSTRRFAEIRSAPRPATPCRAVLTPASRAPRPRPARRTPPGRTSTSTSRSPEVTLHRGRASGPP